MAEAKFQIKWTSDLKDLRKSFAELDKLTKRHEKGRASFRKLDERAHKDEMKRARELFKLKDQERKKDEQHLKQQTQAHTRMAGIQLRSQQLTKRNRAVEQKKENDHNKQQTSFLKKLGGFGLGAIGFGVGAIGGILIGAAFKGYETYLGLQKQLGSSIGLGYKGGILGNAFKSGGARYGYNVGDVSGFMPLTARATGQSTPEAARALMAATRATGMEAGEVGDLFGAIRQGGTSFAKQQQTIGGKKQVFSLGVREFERVQAGALFSGLEKARFPEFAEGISQLIRRAGTTAAGIVDATGYTKLAALFGRAGGEGFKGQRGLAKLAKFEQGVTAPGGGDEGQAIIMQALGFGRPGSGVGFFQATRRQEKGLQDQNTFRDVMEYLNRMSGGNRDERAYLGKQLGIASSMQDMDALQKIYEESKDGTDIQKKLQEELDKTKPIEEQGFIAMKEARTDLARIAAKFDESAALGAKIKDIMESVEDLQRALVLAVLDLAKWIKELIGGKDSQRKFANFLGIDVEREEKNEALSKRIQAAWHRGMKTPVEGAGGAGSTVSESLRFSQQRDFIEKKFGAQIGSEFFKWGYKNPLPGQTASFLDPTKMDKSQWPPELVPALTELVKNSKEMVNHAADAKATRHKPRTQAPADPGVPMRVSSSSAPTAAGRKDSTGH